MFFIITYNHQTMSDQYLWYREEYRDREDVEVLLVLRTVFLCSNRISTRYPLTKLLQNPLRPLKISVQTHVQLA
jgi:hypothetical protein